MTTSFQWTNELMDEWTNALPGLRSQGHFSGVGNIEHLSHLFIGATGGSV